MVTTKKTREASERSAKPRKEMSDVQRVTILVIGDAMVFLIFAMLGGRAHGKLDGLAAFPSIVVTALPFAAGWFLVAPFVGVYKRNLMTEPRAMLKRTLLAWVLAWPVAMALRGIFVDHAVPPLSFALITLAFNALILSVWRWPYALNHSLRQGS